MIWPLNFVALCVSGLAVVSQAAPRDIAAWLALLVASVAFAVGWAHEFYVPHHLGRAAVLLACAAILTWLLVVVTGGLVAWAGWVLVPYAVWLTVATSLAVGYWQPRCRPRRRPVPELSRRECIHAEQMWRKYG